METVNMIITICGMVTSFGSACVMLYSLARFVGKPNKTQDERLNEHDAKFRDIEKRFGRVEDRLEEGTVHFKALDEGTAVTQGALIAIMDSLEKILPTDADKRELHEKKKELYDYLTQK